MWKLSVILLATLVVTTTTGCIGPTQFVKPGATSAQFEQDKAQCTYEAKLHQPQDPFMWPDTVRSCLYARGWTAQR